MGSGHFLVAAANRIAKRLAAVRSGESEPSPDAVREALRDVVGRCLYGVDVNPMALELAKVSLWLEAHVPGKPLTFLDHHLKAGNSLIGATPALIERGIPEIGVNPVNPDFVALAEAFGAGAARPASLDAFKSALTDALSADGPTLLELREDAPFLE